MGTNGERRGSAQLVLKLITFNSARLPPVPAGSLPSRSCLVMKMVVMKMVVMKMVAFQIGRAHV